MFRLAFALLHYLLTTLMESTPPGGDEGPPAPSQGSEKKHTDEDLNKFKGSARQEGRNTGTSAERQRWLDELGVKDEDEAKTLISSYRQHQQANQTELEIAQQQVADMQEKLADAQTEVETAQLLVDESRVHAELRVALIEAGVNPGRVQKILNDEDMPEVEVAEGKVNQDHVKAYVEEAKNEWSEFFGSSRGIPPSPPPGGTTEIDPVEAYLSKTYGERKEN